MKYIVKLNEPVAIKVEHTGGKGANLAILYQRGFPVPDGFVVHPQAYRDFIKPMETASESIAAFSYGDASLLITEAGAFRDLLNQLSLPDLLMEELQILLSQHPGIRFAVRSSSTLEDSAGAAFAGQHDTYLNCLGFEEISSKIKSCFLSLWSDRAIAYRHQQGYGQLQVAMAVVLQEMVPSEVSGVAFSINPISGNINEALVNSNFGLGESVVGGEGEVDHFEIDKRTGRVTRSHIGAKRFRAVCSNTGTKEIAASPSEERAESLNTAQLTALWQMALKAETDFSFPQDIEWGFHEGKLFLFQSRPVTTIPPRWTRDESAERFPNPITPLTWDFVESGFHRSLTYSFKLMGFQSFRGQWFGKHDHYIYGNQNAVEIYGRRSPFQVKSLNDLKESLPRLRAEFRWVQELPILWARDLDYYLMKLGEFMAEPLFNKTIPELWSLVLKINEQGSQYFLPNIAISITQTTLYRVAYGLTVMLLGKEEGTRLFDGMIAFCDTRTSTINKELFELAIKVRQSPDLRALFHEVSSRRLWDEGLLVPFHDFFQTLELFLRNHGHREVDFDAYSPTWIEIPWVVLDNIRLIAEAPSDERPEVKERRLKVRMQEAEFELFKKLPEELHFFFHELFRLVRVYTSLDDLEHYQTTRLTLPLRRTLRELGERLVTRGYLDDPMDVFFARWEELNRAVAADDPVEWRALASIIRDQKRFFLEARQRKPEWVLGQKESSDNPIEGFSGLAGSAGEASGPVHIVSGPEDFSKFPKGSVLVARTTNPTWTPLFYNAVAVVTESGGPLSHGAVTAREMGIPAVLSVRNCLSQLKNGQRVRVDGLRGKVYLEEPEEVVGEGKAQGEPRLREVGAVAGVIE